MHLVLLGDSIFDNAGYVAQGEPDVCAQLQAHLKSGDRALRLAADGNTIEDVASQVKRLPVDATHLIVSIGGNNLLMQLGVLDEPATSVYEVMDRLAQIASSFTETYEDMLTVLLAHGLPTVVCTIYNPRFPTPELQLAVSTALRVFDDCIIGCALEAGIPVIELRAVCNEVNDYANPIEPSAQGGEKIAQAILRVIEQYDFSTKRTQIFT